ncbi:MAG: SDR family NAD(P)-dependent oxidoreductase [Candidatus Methylacidiphilales bacterium]
MKRHILLTGASRGCGLALACFFHREGHAVSACGRSARPSDLPEGIGYERLDVREARAVEAWAESLRNKPAPDLVINNAAVINRSAPLWELSQEETDLVFDINIKGTVNVIRAFAPRLIQAGRGIFVNFSSGWGRSTSPEVAPYCATKWAIEGLSQALAQELPAGLASIALNPGIINTEMLRSCFGSGAAAYPDPEAWAEKAGPFLLKLSAKDNGRSLDVLGES